MLNPFSSPVFSSFRPHLLLFYSYTLCVVLLFCGEESGSEAWMRRVWMTIAIDLKSPLECFFWASLSYESLSYYDEFNAWHQKRFGHIPSYKIYNASNGKYRCEIQFNIPENDKGVQTSRLLSVEGETRSQAREEAANLLLCMEGTKIMRN